MSSNITSIPASLAFSAFACAAFPLPCYAGMSYKVLTDFVDAGYKVLTSFDLDRSDEEKRLSMQEIFQQMVEVNDNQRFASLGYRIVKAMGIGYLGLSYNRLVSQILEMADNYPMTRMDEQLFALGTLCVAYQAFRGGRNIAQTFFPATETIFSYIRDIQVIKARDQRAPDTIFSDERAVLKSIAKRVQRITHLYQRLYQAYMQQVEETFSRISSYF